MSEYLWQTFELPQRSSAHYVATIPVEPPRGYELCESHVAGHSAVILWKKKLRSERFYANRTGVTVEVKRAGAADGNQEFLTPGAATDLGPDDVVIEPGSSDAPGPETPRIPLKPVILGDILINDDGVRIGKIGSYWGSLSPGQARLLALNILSRFRGAVGDDHLLFWRGSASNLATEISAALTVRQLQALEMELSVELRKRVGDKG